MTKLKLNNITNTLNLNFQQTDSVIKDITHLIDEAKNHVAREYSSTQAILFWFIGKRIDEEILKSERAEYGESIVSSLSAQLTLDSVVKLF